jgi:hypothetical protein
MSALLTAALEYAAKRLPVFPCEPCGKTPAVRRGFHSATTNPETIRRHWRIADRNIGIPTGSVSGFWVLDIDVEKDGEASIRALEAKHGRLPRTREVLTGGDGRHLWWKYTGPTQSTTGRIAPGIDTRGDGGYVICPPSIHPSGRVYAWSVDSYDQLATAPDWLMRLARKSPGPTISERALEAIRAPQRSQRATDAYGLTALDREIEALAATGSRWSQPRA